MSELDDKLREIIKEQYEPLLNNADEMIAQIKQVVKEYLEAGGEL